MKIFYNKATKQRPRPLKKPPLVDEREGLEGLYHVFSETPSPYKDCFDPDEGIGMDELEGKMESLELEERSSLQRSQKLGEVDGMSTSPSSNLQNLPFKS